MNIESIKILYPKPISIARPLSTISSNSSNLSITPHNTRLLSMISSDLSPSISHISPLSLSISPSINTQIITNIQLENSRSCIILPRHMIISPF